MTVFADNRKTLEWYRRLTGATHENAPPPALGSTQGGRNGPPGGRGAGSRVPSPACGKSGMNPASCGNVSGKPPVVSRRTEGPWMDSRRVYASKLQASVAGRLDQERRIGGLVSVIPEVSIPVGRDGDETVRHRIDFLAILEVRPDGSFVGRWIEAKGRDLPAGRAKRGAVRALYGTPVEVWK